MPRISIHQADQILDEKVEVLDHGFVRLVDYMGGDERIVSAARVSYGEGTRSVRDDARLIDYLMRHGHTSPFEQVVLTFHVRLPIFVARQWIRHRTARVNEMSGRYSVLTDDFYVPRSEDLRKQSKRNKQARGEEGLGDAEAARILRQLESHQAQSFQTYRDFLSAGLARELARLALPVSVYTEWYWQIDLHNLFHFLRLRLSEDAQPEIRAYAQVLATMTERVAPIAYASFEEHILYATSISRTEKELVRRALVESNMASEVGDLFGKLGKKGQS
jgi:thymidylate synthase (FAD)